MQLLDLSISLSPETDGLQPYLFTSIVFPLYDYFYIYITGCGGNMCNSLLMCMHFKGKGCLD